MNISCIGTGYVGLVTGVCLSSIGHNVTCIDINADRIQQLKQGHCPIYEPGLAELMKQQADRLSFSTHYDSVQKADMVFLAVGTPSSADGSVNCEALFNAMSQLAPLLSDDTIVVVKSTVPIGTNQRIADIIAMQCPHLKEVHVASNPEFLREGSAINDFMNPDRIIIGIEQASLQEAFNQLYAPFKHVIQFTNRVTSEIIKYASNCFLAIKVAFINELSDLCRASGGHIDALSLAMGTDPRIGPLFLKPGPGIGGSCFPKDIRGLSHIMRTHHHPSSIIDGVIKSNTQRIKNMVTYIQEIIPSPTDITLLGLTFKANTDDTRESSSIAIAQMLSDLNYTLHCYDPMHSLINHDVLPKNCQLYPSANDAISASKTIVVLTEWPDFQRIKWAKLNEQHTPYTVIDLRNMLCAKTMSSYVSFYNLNGFIGSPHTEDELTFDQV